MLIRVPYKTRTPESVETLINKGVTGVFVSDKKSQKVPATKNSKLFLGVFFTGTPLNKGVLAFFISDKKGAKASDKKGANQIAENPVYKGGSGNSKNGIH